MASQGTEAVGKPGDEEGIGADGRAFVALSARAHGAGRVWGGDGFERGAGEARGDDRGAGEEGSVDLRDVREAGAGVPGRCADGGAAADPGSRAEVAGRAGGGGADRAGAVRLPGFPAR